MMKKKSILAIGLTAADFLACFEIIMYLCSQKSNNN